MEVVAKDDEYDEEVELEKFRRLRFVFLLCGDEGTSSSVSSSVVLFGSVKRFRYRFRAALSVVVVVAEDDVDVSVLRFFIAAIE